MRYYFILILFVLVGCNSSIDKRNIDQRKLIADSILSVPIDDRTNPQTLCLSIIQDDQGQEMFAYLNQSQNELQFYSLYDSIQLIKRIKFEMEGPNRCGRVFGFYYYNMDSIYIRAMAPYSIFLFNSDGEKMDSYNYLNNYKDDTIISNYYILPWLPAYQINNELIFPFVRNVTDRYDTPEELSNCNLSLILNQKSGGLRIPNWFMEKKIFNKDNKILNYSRVFNGDNFVYSFNKKHDLIKTDITHENYTYHNAKSSFFDSFKSKSNAPDDVESILREGVLTPNYFALIYDKYRNIYYRLAYRANNMGKDIDLMKATKYMDEFSVIVLDSNLIVIDEILLPKGTYYHRNYFVRKDGLYLSINHPDNPEFEENLLKFQRFNYVK